MKIKSEPQKTEGYLRLFIIKRKPHIENRKQAIAKAQSDFKAAIEEGRGIESRLRRERGDFSANFFKPDQ